MHPVTALFGILFVFPSAAVRRHLDMSVTFPLI